MFRWYKSSLWEKLVNMHVNATVWEEESARYPWIMKFQNIHRDNQVQRHRYVIVVFSLK